MLLKELYTLHSVENTGGEAFTVHITVNAQHPIIKGHFPGNPVMPGVCMMQIIKEITQKIMDAPLVLQSASNVKFTALINPEVNPDLKLELEVHRKEDGLVKVKNISYFNETIALKLACIFAKG
jgi:3-hydroxyacyl-[acyl-carrier-protein] dehydratase